MDPITIFVHPRSRGGGSVFDVTLDGPNGEMIAKRVRDPEHVAGRILLERGFAAHPLHAFAPSLTRPGVWTPTLRFRSVSAAARVRVQETEKTGPRIVKHKPFQGIAPKRAIAA